MSNTADNYLFLGLPASGKTTYFSVMARQLQNYANVTDGIEFLFLPSDNGEEITSDFIQDCILRLKDQRWVMKTQDYFGGYSFWLKKKEIECMGLLEATYTYVINYHDYPGEAFQVAFGRTNDSTDNMRYVAKKMTAAVQGAKGIFLIVDAETFFTGERDREFRSTLENMLWFIRVNNPAVKLAIIFNKLELFLPTKYTSQEIMAKMRKDYSNAYSRLPKEHKFFTVYPLGKVETAENGKPIPPKKLSPKQIFDPIGWMLGFNLPSEFIESTPFSFREFWKRIKDGNIWTTELWP